MKCPSERSTSTGLRSLSAIPIVAFASCFARGSDLSSTNVGSDSIGGALSPAPAWLSRRAIFARPSFRLAEATNSSGSAICISWLDAVNPRPSGSEAPRVASRLRPAATGNRQPPPAAAPASPERHGQSSAEPRSTDQKLQLHGLRRPARPRGSSRPHQPGRCPQLARRQQRTQGMSRSTAGSAAWRRW